MNLTTPYLIIAVLLFPLLLHAQTITLDFENNDIADWVQWPENRWGIDTSALGGSSSLHHIFDNSAAGVDKISYQLDNFKLTDTSTWKFTIKYPYNPSGTNKWAVFLNGSENAVGMDKGGTANAYVFGVNFTGNSDAIELWKQENGSVSSLYESDFLWGTNLQNGKEIRFLITRYPNGQFNFNADTTGSGYSINLGSAEDNSLASGNNFGVYYSYTSSKDRLLWVDDIEVTGDFSVDTIAPTIDSAFAPNEKSLQINFSENIVTTGNTYFVLNNADTAETIEIISGKTLLVIFNSYFNDSNQINIFNVSDISGNQLKSNKLAFLYPMAAYHNILISEIYPNPEPSLGLPTAEYFEIYNAGGETYNLSNYKLIINDKQHILPASEIAPGTYAIVCARPDTAEFTKYGQVIGVPGLSALTNNNGSITLRNIKNKMLYHLNYDISWHQNNYKTNGGWSLEMIDINNPCTGEGNWGSSVASIGGTPGLINSINAENQDVIPPEIQSVYANNSGLTITFSETVDSLWAATVHNYTVNQNVGQPESVSAHPPDFTMAQLNFNMPFDTAKTYTLTINGNITDCAGNSMANPTNIEFGLAACPDSGTVIINEFMYEPGFEYAEYIELYNNSNTWINIKELFISDYDSFTGTTSNEIPIIYQNMLFAPYSFLCITDNKEYLLNFRPALKPQKIIEPPKWQPLTNDGKTIALSHQSGKTLDAATYHPKMHYQLLAETKNVSLERIDYSKPGLLLSSWHSAASTANYATPLEENSHNETLPDRIHNKNGVIVLDNKKFTPNNDGYQDFLMVNYLFNETGWTATCIVFDTNGNIIKYLANNKLLGTMGYLPWHGTNSNGLLVTPGHYIVYFGAFNKNGKKLLFKETCLVLP